MQLLEVRITQDINTANANCQEEHITTLILPYSGLLLRGPKFCESVKIDPAEIFAIAKFASQSGVGSREL